MPIGPTAAKTSPPFARSNVFPVNGAHLPQSAKPWRGPNMNHAGMPVQRFVLVFGKTPEYAALGKSLANSFQEQVNQLGNVFLSDINDNTLTIIGHGNDPKVIEGLSAKALAKSLVNAGIGNSQFATIELIACRIGEKVSGTKMDLCYASLLKFELLCRTGKTYQVKILPYVSTGRDKFRIIQNAQNQSAVRVVDFQDASRYSAYSKQDSRKQKMSLPDWAKQNNISYTEYSYSAVRSAMIPAVISQQDAKKLQKLIKKQVDEEIKEQSESKLSYTTIE
jgi:hypothetical protein